MTEFGVSEPFEGRVKAAQRSCNELEALTRVLGTSDDTPMHRSEIRQRTKKLDQVLKTLRSELSFQDGDGVNEPDQWSSRDLVEKLTKKLSSIKRTSDMKMKDGNRSNQTGQGLLSDPQGGNTRNPFYDTIGDRSDKQEQAVADLESKQEHAIIQGIANDTVQVSEAFQILADMVNDQGSDVDILEENSIETREQISQGMMELEKAKAYQTKRRRRLFCMFLLSLAIITGVTLIISSFAND